MARTNKTPEQIAEAKANRKPVKRLPTSCLPIVKQALKKHREEADSWADHPAFDKAAYIANIDKAIAHFSDEPTATDAPTE
jgi:hypothetical protein